MRILTKSIQGTNIHLWNRSQVLDYESRHWSDGLTLSEWMDDSVEINISGTTRNIFKVGDTFTLTGSNDFVRDGARSDTDTDYWVLTESGVMIQLQILSGASEIGTVLSIARSEWMFRDNAGDYYRRNWRLLGGNTSIAPVEVKDIVFKDNNNLLAEDSFPEIQFNVKIFGTRDPRLRRIVLGGHEKEFFQYQIASMPWRDYDKDLGVRIVSDDSWVDGSEIPVKIRFITSETQTHKLRDTTIHIQSNYEDRPFHDFNLRLYYDGKYDTADETDLNIYKSPFEYNNAGQDLGLGNIRMNTLKIKYNTTDPDNILLADAALIDSSFNGSWREISDASFQNSLNTIDRADGTALPDAVWMAGDNGSLYHVVNGTVVDSVMSHRKWNGSNRFTSASTGGAIHLTGDTTIYDINDSGLCNLPQTADKLPYSYNNFATVQVSSGSPMQSLTIKTENDADSVPAGTIDMLRSTDETQWNTIMNQPMDIGDFFVHENDPVKLEETKKKPTHNYTITFRKIPGYLFDVAYPAEQNRNLKLTVSSTSRIYDLNQNDIIDAGTSKTLNLNISRTNSRWGLDEIPNDPKYSAQASNFTAQAGENGMAQLLARRITRTETLGVLHPNIVEEDWAIGAGLVSGSLLDCKHEFTDKFRVTCTNAGSTAGADAVEVKMITDGPYNQTCKVMECTNGAPTTNNDGNADGGWRVQHLVDPYWNYASVVFVRVTSNTKNGRFHHGPGNWGGHPDTKKLDGTPQTNVYYGHYAASNMTQDEWYVSVGILRYVNASNDTNHYGGMWKLSDGSKVATWMDLKHGDARLGPNINRNNHRVYMHDGQGGMTFQLTNPMLVRIKWSDMYDFYKGFLHGFNPRQLTQDNPQLRGAYKFSGSVDGADDLPYTEIVNGQRSVTNHPYTAGVLIESKELDARSNLIVVNQSANPGPFHFPEATLGGGRSVGDLPDVAGGSPGSAVTGVNANTVVNNQGTIQGDVTLT